MGRLSTRHVFLAAAGLLAAAALFFFLVRGLAKDDIGPAGLWPGTGEWARAQLRELTPEQKVAQLFSAAVQNRSRLVDLVERFEAGGIVLGEDSPAAQASLVENLQRRARVPLLVTRRLRPGEPGGVYPVAMAVAATGDADVAYAAGHAEARRARRYHVGHLPAPSSGAARADDSSGVGTTSFGGVTDVVADMLPAYTRGVQAGGAVAAVAYVPGRPEDAGWFSNLSGLSGEEADPPRPLRTAIQEGLMSVIVGAPGEEPDGTDSLVGPAPLPDAVVRELRETLGFRGLIAADVEDMRRADLALDTRKAAVRLLGAGADLLFVSQDAYEARDAVLEALTTGQLSQDRIDESVMRILRAKAWLGLAGERDGAVQPVSLTAPAGQVDVMDDIIAHASLTLLRNEGELLPLLNRPRILVAPVYASQEATGDVFIDHLRSYAGDSMITVYASGAGTGTSPDDLVGEVDEQDVVVVPVFTDEQADSSSRWLTAEERAFIDNLVAAGKPVVLIAFGSPYVIREVSAPAAYVAAYSPDLAVQTAVAQALFGRSGFQGRLPVAVPGFYDAGEGLQLDQVMIRRGYPEEIGMSRLKLEGADSLIRAAVQQGAFPGAAVAIGRAGVLTKLQGYGYFTYDEKTPVTPQSLFDLASLTKVIATTTAVMKLHEQGRLNIMAPVGQYFPEFREGRKRSVTIWNLLTHSAGLIPFRPYHTMGLRTREEVIEAILSEPLQYEPGTKTEYSDHGLILLGLIIEQITGQDLATWTKENVFEPLGMRDTGFRPVGVGRDEAVVPTEVDESFRKRLMQGEVHDETAYLLGGTAGHAGLFSTAEDLSRFAFMLLNDGRANGRQFLRPETIDLFTTRVQLGEETTRAIGWDTKSTTGYTSAGQFFGPNSFGHTGFTGTSFWIDPDAQLFVILLTNRVYPTRENRAISEVRPKLADIAFGSIIGPPEPILFSRPPQQEEERTSSRAER